MAKTRAISPKHYSKKITKTGGEWPLRLEKDVGKIIQGYLATFNTFKRLKRTFHTRSVKEFAKANVKTLKRKVTSAKGKEVPEYIIGHVQPNALANATLLAISGEVSYDSALALANALELDIESASENAAKSVHEKQDLENFWQAIFKADNNGNVTVDDERLGQQLKRADIQDIIRVTLLYPYFGDPLRQSLLSYIKDTSRVDTGRMKASIRDVTPNIDMEKFAKTRSYSGVGVSKGPIKISFIVDAVSDKNYWYPGEYIIGDGNRAWQKVGNLTLSRVIDAALERFRGNTFKNMPRGYLRQYLSVEVGRPGNFTEV